MATDTNLDQKIAEAKAAGYTDEEIKAYLNPQAPVQQEKDRSEEYAGMGEFGAGKAAQYGLEAGGAYLGGKKLLQAAGNALRPPVPAATPAAPTALPAPVTPPAPTPAPSFTGGANPAWDEALSKPFNPAAPKGAPATPPTPPVGGPAAQQGTTFLDRIIQQYGQARQAVAPVIEQAATKAAPLARAAGTVGALVTPGNVGQNYGAQFPQKGPMAGMEINPNTHRPWTPQELAAYNSQF